MIKRSLLLCGLGVLVGGGLSQARVPTIDELIELRSPGELAVSPDGRTVAFTVTETNWEEDRYEREIWLVRQGGAPIQFTRAERSSYAPAFSPDGSTLYFVSDRGEKRQLYRMELSGGEAVELTSLEEGVRSFEPSPSGDWIALTALDPESEARKSRKERFGELTLEDEDHRMTHLFKLDLDTGELERLTEGQSFTVDDFAVSPDGARVAFSARPHPDPSAFLLSDIHVVNLEGRLVSTLVDWPGADSAPRWSPMGDRIAFQTSGGVATYYGNDEIGVVPAAGGEPAILTRGHDEDAGLVGWRGDGLYFISRQRTERHLYRLQPDGSDLSRISSDGWVLGSVALAVEGSRMAFTADRFDRFTEVYLAGPGPFDPERVSSFDDQLEGLTLSEREVIRWTSTDGTEIEGVLVKPPGLDRGERRPLLFKIHGGPTGVDARQKLTGSDRRYYPIERFVARGALVLMVNYRGSAGYGAEFRALNVRNLGVGDAWDVESGLDHLIERGLVDPERVGTMGWSQGGYISAFLTTHSSARFRAASVGAGISDWMTYYVNTDIHPFTRQYLKATPWEDPEIYARTSPITYVARARTPTLIQHGEKDARVPIPNAYELYQALRDHDVPVRLAVYQGFGHGIDRPKSNRAVMTHNEEWFGKWIWGDDTLPSELDRDRD